MKPIYIFSGLGADERVFQNLDFSPYDPVFIKWLRTTPNETIEDYAAQVAKQIRIDKPILVGLSFGGILAIEVAKIIDIEKLILIASAKSRKEIPFYYRLAGYINIHKLLPSRFLKRPGLIGNWFFSVRTKDEKKMLADILRDSDSSFLKWAINQIVKWKNKTPPQNTYHIHGTADRILPYRFVRADFKVANGGHFMTVNKSVEINKQLRTLL